MNTDSKHTDWEPCPRGTLSGLSDGLKRRRRRGDLSRAAGVVSVLLVALVASWYAVQPKPGHPEFHFGGIACSEVQRDLPKYLAGELEQSIVDKIDLHLAACDHCREAVEHMRSSRATVDRQLLDEITRTLASNDF